MANFDIAYQITAQHEGGWVNDPLDRGGETYKGIARNYHPNWSGWSIIDSLPTPLKYPNAFFANAELDRLVQEFYRINFWDFVQGDSIWNQQVANVIYDWRVNSGQAIKLIQRDIFATTADGIIGPITLNLINKFEPESLVKEITNLRVNYYQQGVTEGWLSSAFLSGLQKRALAFLDDITDTVKT